jgi:hypothetical protein
LHHAALNVRLGGIDSRAYKEGRIFYLVWGQAVESRRRQRSILP